MQSNKNKNIPYADLNPHLILDAIDSIGLQTTGSLFALNSYENRVYQIGTEEHGLLIAKFYRPNRWSDAAILEEHAFAFALNQQEIPIVPPFLINDQSLHHYAGYRFALFPRRGGRTVELDNMDHLFRMGRLIGRIHAVGASQPYQHRPALTVKTHGIEPFDFLIQTNFIPDFLKSKFIQTISSLLKKIEDAFQTAGKLQYVRVHGDCHAGNVLWSDAGPHMVDLDDSVMAPAIQDIWMLLSGHPVEIEAELQAILAGYCEFYDFNYRELNLIEAFRSLRMIQYAAWLAARFEDPAFPPAFPWFNTPSYWQQLWHDLQDQEGKM